MEIFFLLLLKKFNLDCVHPDESKRKEEERRRYHLIPQTFCNWLQAFSILASAIGKKVVVTPGFGMTNNFINGRWCAHLLDGTTKISVCG